MAWPMLDVAEQVDAASAAFADGERADALELQDAYFEMGVDVSRLKQNAWPSVQMHASHGMHRGKPAVNILPRKDQPLDPWGDLGETNLVEGAEFVDPFTGERFVTLHQPFPDAEKEHSASSDVRLEKALGRVPEKPKREVSLVHPCHANTSVDKLDYLDIRARGEVVANNDVYLNRSHMLTESDFDAERNPELYDGENLRPSNEQRARRLVDTNRGRLYTAPEKTLKNEENTARLTDPGVNSRRRLNGSLARRSNPAPHVEL